MAAAPSSRALAGGWSAEKERNLGGIRAKMLPSAGHGGCLVRPSALKRLIKSPDLASYPVSIPRSHRRPLPGQAVACPGRRTAAAPGQWAGRFCFLARPKTPPGGEFRRDYYGATSADLWRRFILIPLPE
jgi:hypothetical protein